MNKLEKLQTSRQVETTSLHLQEIIILALSIISALAAFVQIQKLSHSFNVPYDLDTLLSSITVTGSYIYGVFGMLASIFSISETRSMVVFAQCALLVIQVTMQGESKWK